MDVLVHDYGGRDYEFQLSRGLARRGHRVWHAYGTGSAGPKAAFDVAACPNLTVVPIPGRPVAGGDFIARYVEEWRYGGRFARAFARCRPDLILIANTPLDALTRIHRFASARQARFVLWLTDLRSKVAHDVLGERLGVVGRAVARRYEAMERRLVAGSDHVVSITEGFQPVTRAWGLPDRRLSVIPNWAPLDAIQVRAKDNSFARAHGLHDKFVVLYAGTMGMKHDPDLLVDCAERLRASPGVEIVVVSEGMGRDHLERERHRRGLGNLRLLPYQPYATLADMYGAADLLITMLEPSASRYSVPSKVYSGLCAGRPSILVMPPDNLAAQMVVGAEAGIVVPRDDALAAQVVAAIERLRASASLRVAMGRNARRHAETHFDIERITARFETAFARAMVEPVANRPGWRGRLPVGTATRPVVDRGA